MANGDNLYKPKGFTFIELTVVMAVIALIISIAMPRYFDGLERGKETALKQNLKEMREAIDHYHTDKGEYPINLQTLVSERYLRFIPADPITEMTDTWLIIAPPDNSNRVYDVASGATTASRSGEAYNTW
ncbi:MAG: prepilin-type N-terminal cleavage/methylation domain-containing protein [Methylotenera sp.]|uniref:type II secretion system protein n=1 Tax=Methylotenera sp. TaxID=2051956 RepID=UPI0017D85ECF|nr:type II secretion system protein [Methylotenera sp.]NOU25054.1 prepilin-type N-terminal cleavage/methylation domain-containing protein [Methylotenera sp.]